MVESSPLIAALKRFAKNAPIKGIKVGRSPIIMESARCSSILWDANLYHTRSSKIANMQKYPAQNLPGLQSMAHFW